MFGTKYRRKKGGRRRQRRNLRVVKRTNKMVGKITTTKDKMVKLWYKPPRYDKMPIPDIYHTTFYTEYQGNNNLAGNVPASSGYFDVKMNSIYLPYYVGTVGIDANSNFSNPLSGSSPATLAPTGSSQLCNINMYNYFYVMKSTITVYNQNEGIWAVDNVAGETQGIANSAQMLVSIVPYAITSGGAPPTDYFSSLKQPHAVSTNFKAIGGAQKLSHSITPAAVIGVPEKAFEYDISGSYSGGFVSDPPEIYFWRIFWQLADLTSKSIYQGIRVVVSHETILDGLARDLSITAPTPP